MGPHRRLPHSASKTAFSWRRWFFRGSSTSEHCRRCRKLQCAWQECGWQVRSEGGGILLSTPTLAPAEEESLAGFLDNIKLNNGRSATLLEGETDYGELWRPSVVASFQHYPSVVVLWFSSAIHRISAPTVYWMWTAGSASSGSHRRPVVTVCLSRAVHHRPLGNSLGTGGS
jgi:hypothetical protein